MCGRAMPRSSSRPSTRGGQDRRTRLDAAGQGRGLPEAGQVDGDDVEVLGERGQHGIPRLTGESQNMQQHQRRPDPRRVKASADISFPPMVTARGDERRG